MHIKKVNALELELFKIASQNDCAPRIIKVNQQNEKFLITTELYPVTINDLIINKQFKLAISFLFKSKEILRKLHQLNILHRDVSEDNIVCNLETNEVKFIDFGMSQKLSSIIDINIKEFQELYYEEVKYAANPEPTIDYVMRLEFGCIDFLIDAVTKKI